MNKQYWEKIAAALANDLVRVIDLLETETNPAEKKRLAAMKAMLEEEIQFTIEQM